MGLALPDRAGAAILLVAGRLFQIKPRPGDELANRDVGRDEVLLVVVFVARRAGSVASGTLRDGAEAVDADDDPLRREVNLFGEWVEAARLAHLEEQGELRVVGAARHGLFDGVDLLAGVVGSGLGDGGGHLLSLVTMLRLCAALA